MGAEEMERATAILTDAEPAGEGKPAAETIVNPPPASGAGDAAPGGAPGESGVVPAKTDDGKTPEGAPPPPSDAKALEDKPGEAVPDAAVTEALKPFQEIMETAGIENPEQLRGTVQDAMVLYDVIDGKQKASALLEAVRATQPPEVFQRILADVMAYAAQHGASPAPAKPGENGKPPVEDSIQKAVLDLRTRFESREQQEEQQRVYQHRMETVVKPFQKRIEDLGKKEGLDEDDIAGYSAAVSAAIGQDLAALKRLEAGKFGDVDRLFTAHHNKQLALLKKWSDRTTAQKTDAQKTAPRIPAGGSPPAPTQPVTLPPAKNSEERIERSRQILSGEIPVQ